LLQGAIARAGIWRKLHPRPHPRDSGARQRGAGPHLAALPDGPIGAFAQGSTRRNGKDLQMINPSQVRERMEVVGDDGKHVGTVDHCENDRIKLARNDPAAQGQHHYIDMALVDRVDGNRLCLSVPAGQAMQQWQTA
jgi:hypothetical protein